MNLSSITSRALSGIESPIVTVEVHVSNGLPSLSIVGLPEASVKESKYRVRSALLSSGFQIPPKRITVNLAPADLPKSGGRYDLPIAIGILIATGQLDCPDIQNFEFIGELALNGEVRAIKGTLPSLLAAQVASRTCILPKGNLAEAILSQPAHDLAANFVLIEDLKEACRVLLGEQLEPLIESKTELKVSNPSLDYPQDLADFSGQLQAKRVLEIAASGRHSLIMVDSPGSGKSMLASRLVTLLPALTQQEAIESATIHSINGQEIGGEHFDKRPFVNPHHTASAAAQVGGGSIPKPGAISLVHNGLLFGLLFLDKLLGFTRTVLESLRKPLEGKWVEISRVNQQVNFPAVDLSDLQGEGALGESSAQVRARVVEVRAFQLKRQGYLSCDLSPKALKEHVVLDALSLVILEKAVNQLGISARGYHRILRIARTLADMEKLADLSSQYIAEALRYRTLDRVH
ncbi:MAG: YifB family Mg chelatase-like AAA ATPase [Pseudomonadota bacterium]